MDDIKLIFKLLESSGIRPLGMDSTNLYIEDPSCIARSFETFLENVWIVSTFITGMFLIGWAWGMIRGNKNLNFQILSKNIVSLLAIFATFSIIPAVVNFIYGGDLIGYACKTAIIPTAHVKKLLDMRKDTLEKFDAYNLYEDLIIYDSGVNIDASISESVDTTNPQLQQSTITSADTGTTLSDTNIQTKSNTSTSTPVHAEQSDKDTVYITQDGQKYKKVGGTLAWRNNNPGNIRYTEFARRAGAIAGAHGFAVFPDKQTGRDAIKRLLVSKNYKDLTIANAVSRYAPPSENNTAGYQRSLANMTGLSINRRMSDLSDTELEKVVSAIAQIEGWKEGKTVFL